MGSDMSQDLKTCPFCGGVAQYDDFRNELYGLDQPGVECAPCNVRNFAETKALAVAAWNRRAQLSGLVP